jgi:CheY-like chemotaxis protein
MGNETRDDGRGHLILLVEDELPAVRLFQLAVEELDRQIEVEVATDGHQALDRLVGGRAEGRERRQPNVVVLDLDLPSVGGVEVLREIRTTPDTAALSVVVMTHRDDKPTIDECLRLGVDDYIIKPDDYEGLLEVARRVSAAWSGGEERAHVHDA